MTGNPGTTFPTAMDVDRTPDDACRNADAEITALAFQEHAALAAVRTGNWEAALRITAAMLPDERATLAGHLEELRKLLGPTCAECGALTELGTCTTDTSSAECRFLCSRCTAARRTP
jgi:hypothetical protein